MICMNLTTFCNLRAAFKSVWPPIASLYTSSSFVNLHWLASPFGQGLMDEVEREEISQLCDEW